MKKHIFLRNMIRFGYMPLIGIMLAGLLNFAVVRGNEVISAVIDQMLAGETVVFGSFLAEFALLTVLGFAAAFAASAVSGKYSVLVSARYRQQVARKLYQVEYSYFDEHSSASVINKVNADLNEAERFLGETFVMLVGDAVAVVVYKLRYKVRAEHRFTVLHCKRLLEVYYYVLGILTYPHYPLPVFYVVVSFRYPVVDYPVASL